MNLYSHLLRAADRFGERAAVHAPAKDGHAVITFGELLRRSARLAGELVALGVGRGDRVVMMVPVSIDLYVVVAGLLRLGAVPVLLDPWMGLERMADCIRRTEPRLFVGIPVAHALFVWRPGLRGLPRVLVGGSAWMGRHRLEAMVAGDGPVAEVADLGDDAPALITFTGGSTGRPKGVFRTHGLLGAQHVGTQGCMGMEPGEVHMQAFPNMVMSNIAAGVTSVIPAFKQGHAAEVDPAALLAQVDELGVAGMCGPPALYARLARHCRETEHRMETVRRVLLGGSAVGFDLLDAVDEVTRPGAAVVLYGSSEAEPLATLEGVEARVEAREALARGAGLCMGRPSTHLPMTLRVIPPDLEWEGGSDADLDEVLLRPGETGELVVSGPHVSREYFGDPEAEAALKIVTDEGTLWHRLGDLGHLDADGRVFLVGRTNDAVEVADGRVHPLAVEPVLDALPDVVRSGVVGVPTAEGTQLVVAFQPSVEGDGPQAAARREAGLRQACEPLGVVPDHVLEVASVPVDRRHNGKIERDELVEQCWRRLHPGRRRR